MNEVIDLNTVLKPAFDERQKENIMPTLYQLVETDEEPEELLESYRRRYVAFAQLYRVALLNAGAPVEVAETIESLFTQVALLIRASVPAVESGEGIPQLEAALDLVNSAFWLSEQAVTQYQAEGGYRLTRTLYEIQSNGLQNLIDQLRQE